MVLRQIIRFLKYDHPTLHRTLKVIFPLFFRLMVKIHIIPLGSFLEHFLGWARFILVGRITKNQYSK